MDDSSKIDELRALVEQDPGNESFIELANLLGKEEQTRAEAREVCLRGLSHNPEAHAGRLVLAKLYYLDSMNIFCVRELLEVKKHVKSASLDKLLASFGELEDSNDSSIESKNIKEEEIQDSQEENSKEVLAEVDIDADFLDILNDLDD